MREIAVWLAADGFWWFTVFSVGRTHVVGRARTRQAAELEAQFA